jgi:UDP-N-acetyl-D-mannosaminuronic acid dehydrogenase
MSDKKICVIGLGYIGLPTAALLTRVGYDVDGVDVNDAVIDTINSGQIHIVEPDLEEQVSLAVKNGKLRAHKETPSADIYMICVPTPFHEEGDIPQPNIDFVISAARKVAPRLKPGNIVILESTSPVGTTEKIAQELASLGVDTDRVHIAYCPERVLPGRIMLELLENDRVVGGLKPEATAAVAAFYRGFVRGAVLETDARTAEMCKLTENSFRDVNIAFANELSIICKNLGIDVWSLIALANRHPRVDILQPGAGVGGHCIAVDPWFIAAADPENSKIIQTARTVNNSKTDWVVSQIEQKLKTVAGAETKTKRVICLGLAFKPDIDDLRESPAFLIASRLQQRGVDVVAVEPNIESHDTIKLIDIDEALNGDDVIAILVKHRDFLKSSVAEKLCANNALDFCGVLV